MRTQIRSRHALPLAAALVIAIGLVGCGDDSSAPTTPGPTVTPHTLLLDGDVGAATIVADSDHFGFIHRTLEFTIEAWVRLEDPADDAFFAIAGSTPMRLERGFFFGYENRPVVGSQLLRLGVNRGTPTYALQAFGDAAALADGAWHHVAVVSIGSGAVLFYVDGSVVTTTIDEYTGVGDGEPTRDVQIGDIHSVETSSDFFLSGGIDDVRIWDVARTASQIAGTRMQHIGPRSGLAGYWRFDEVRDSDGDGEVNDVPDSSGHGNYARLEETARLVEEELF